MTALYVLLIIITIIFLLLFIPVSVRLTAGDDLLVKLYYLCFRITLYPKRQKNRKKGKKAKKGDDTENSKQGKPKKGLIKELFQKHGTLGGIGQIITILKELCTKFLYLTQHIIIRKFDIDITVAGDDAAKTAVEYGAVNALVYPFLAFIDSRMNIKRKKVNINCDFETTECKLSADIFMGVKPLFVLIAAIGSLAKIIAAKGEKNERK